MWGTGKVKREFLNVDDLASAISFSLNKKFTKTYINVGSKDYLSIKDLAKLIKKSQNIMVKLYLIKIIQMELKKKIRYFNT